MENLGMFKVLVTIQNANIETMPIIKNLNLKELLDFVDIDNPRGLHETTQYIFMTSTEATVKVRVKSMEGKFSGLEETVVLNFKDFKERLLFSLRVRPIIDLAYLSKRKESA